MRIRYLFAFAACGCAVESAEGPAQGLSEPRVISTSPSRQDPVEFAIIPSAAVVPPEASGLASIQELSVRANLTRPHPGSVLSLELLHPYGAPWESRQVTLEEGQQGNVQVEFLFPVSGTPIEQMQLSGKWTAQWLLDGALVAQQSIELSP